MSRDVWQKYYQEVKNRKHLPRTEVAVRLNQSGLHVAVDCGCGTGSDIEFLAQNNYRVYGFDKNPDSVEICRSRFFNNSEVTIDEASFENFYYPESGIVLANSSLFFAESSLFERTWQSIVSSLRGGGVFSGDFIGEKDSWVFDRGGSINPLTKREVVELFSDFEIVKFHERSEQGKTAIGREKYWHTFSVTAIKRI